MKVLQGEQAKSEHDSAKNADSSDDSDDSSDDSDDSQATKVHAQQYKYYYYNTNLHGDGTHGVLSAAVQYVWIKIPEFCSTNILVFCRRPRRLRSTSTQPKAVAHPNKRFFIS